MAVALDRHSVAAGPTELWYTRCPVPTTSGIAQHHGWLHREFAAHGIRLDSLRASDDPAVRVSHFDHSQAAMFREGGNIPPIWARAKGQDTALIGITWVDEEQVVLVRGDSAIREVEDLRGKRLGLPTAETRLVDIHKAEHLRGLLTALEIGGLEPSEVEFVDIREGELDLRENDQRQPRPPHPGLDLLRNGALDAIYAKGANSATLIADHGLRPIIDINAQPDRLLRVNAGTPRAITVNRELAIRHPEIVARYLAVLLRTAAWARSHPDEVVATVAAETGATAANVRRAYGPKLQDNFEPKLSREYLDGLANQKNFLREWLFLQGDFDFESWVVPEPLTLARSLTLSVPF